MKAAKSFTRARRKPARSVTASRAGGKRRATTRSKPKSRRKIKRPAPKRVSVSSKAAPRPRKIVRRRKPALKLPPILLEGDHPEMPQISGPGIKFALGPTAPAHHFDNETAELPAAYGTKRLFLNPRDPHWFHAHWDVPRAQQARYNKLSADHHLVLRIFADEAKGTPVSENHVHPESRYWFAHVEQAGVKYVAELGYYRLRANRRSWTRVAASKPTPTPPERVSPDTSFQQATIPREIPLPKLAAMTAKATGGRRLPLARALEYLKTHSHPSLPVFPANAPSNWTQSQQDAMAEIAGACSPTLPPASSVNISELIRGKILEVTGISNAPSSLPTSAGAMVNISSPSSPFGGMSSGQKDFWLNINAELIVYGATEPDAAVSIGGRPVKLRPDGSFSFRFALPDGQYELPVVAVSADKTDGRGAELKFARATEIRGDVGVQPQEAGLLPPAPENI